MYYLQSRVFPGAEDVKSVFGARTCDSVVIRVSSVRTQLGVPLFEGWSPQEQNSDCCQSLVRRLANALRRVAAFVRVNGGLSCNILPLS
jgi:hypothetical protein